MSGEEKKTETSPPEAIQQWIAETKRDGRPLVCFFVDRLLLNPDEYFRFIERRLRKDFSFMALVCGEGFDVNLPVKKFFIEDEGLASLFGIDVILLMNSGSRHPFPQDAAVASFCHSFGAYEHYDYTDYAYMMQFCDAFFVTSEHIFADRQAIESSHVNMIDPRFLQRTRTAYRYLPTGYPRIAAIRDRLAQAKVEPDALLYAPVGMYSNPGERRNRIFPCYGESVVAALLENFPDYQLLYRPYRGAWGVEPYEAIIRKFSGHPRFEVSRNVDRIPDFARAVTCITEHSNIGEVFALATLRPEVARTFDTPYATPRLTRTGVGQSPAGDIVPAVRMALDQPAAFWRTHLSASFGKYIIHPDETVDRIRQCLLALAGRVPFPPHVAIPRQAGLPVWSQQHYLHQALKGRKINIRLLSDWMRVFPDDAVPVALRLLAGMQGDDQLTIMGDGWLTDDILRLLHEVGGFCCQKDTPYAHVPADTPLRLIQYGVEQAVKEGKTVYADLLRHLRLS
ncbi:hypothetical protein [uncultured Desulfovibrio sp.]|uniref:hypothetical protein n=1 Tax=uncultured Desulfovibrio sp. TaxID=167968 RepID=UPI00261C771D|nr:hypothetical protein [uncultured Desulfovibrio sp.]